MPTNKEYAYYGIVVLVDHIKNNENSDSMTMTYKEFSTKINNLDKKNKLRRTGDPLDHIWKFLLEFHKNNYPGSKPPFITILIVDGKTCLPSDGYKTIDKYYNKLNDDEDDKKHERIKEQTELLKEYLRAGRLDKFLSKTVPAEYRDLSTHEDDNCKFAKTEGATIRRHREVEYRSRDCTIVKDKKEESGYTCECCGFNFCETYGKLGKEYIECHHIKPLADYSKKGEKTEWGDLAVLCANCHRMIHRLLRNKTYKDYSLSMDDLRDVMKKQEPKP